MRVMPRSIIPAILLMVLLIPALQSVKAQTKEDFVGEFGKMIKKLEYQQNDTELKNLISAYRSGALYIGLRVQTDGLDPKNKRQFSCADNSFWHFLKKFAKEKNQTFTVEITTTIGGYPMPTVPVLVLSDVDGQCRYSEIDYKMVVPMTRIGGMTDVEVAYNIRSSRSVKFKLFNSLLQVLQGSSKLLGATQLASDLSAPLLQKGADDLAKLINDNSLVSMSGDISSGFDFRKNKGLEFSPAGFPGGIFRMRILAEPGLSIYTKLNTGTGLAMRPVYPSALVVSNEPIYAVEHNRVLKQTSLSRHFKTNQQALSRLTAFKNSSIDTFEQNCIEVREELQSDLRLSEADMLKNFFEILRPTKWYTDMAYRGLSCPSNEELAEMKLLGIPVMSTSISRNEGFALLNSILDRFAGVMRYGTEEKKRAFGETFFSPEIELMDPSDILKASDTKKASLLAAFSKFRADAVGCYSTGANEPPVTRTALVVGEDHKNRMAFSINVKRMDASTKVNELSVDLVKLIPLDKKDSTAQSLIDRVNKTDPTDSCKALLKEYFSDF